MAFLKKHKKVDLRELAIEMGIQVEDSDQKFDIIDKIQKSPRYDEPGAKDAIQVVVEERELAEAEKKAALAAAREFELAKLKLTNSADAISIESSHESVKPTRNINSVMQKYDGDKIDMALFLTLFERQARKLRIEDDDLVSQLLSLMPIDIAEIVIREPEDKNDCYEHVKGVLLNRFKLTPEAFRKKFQTHQRQGGALWKDLVFDLKSYLDNWLQGVNVTTFEELKNLMVADQLKKRAPNDVKDHFIDQWGELTDPSELADKLDSYEATRRFVKKPQPTKPPERKFPDRPKLNEKPSGGKGTGTEKSDHKNGQNTNNLNSDWRTKEFEKRKGPICYNCNKYGHISPQCPEPKKGAQRINSLASNANLTPSFEPFLSCAKINNVNTVILRDTGSSIDLAHIRLIKLEDFTGERVWLKQPLDNEFRSLPLAKIKIEDPEIGVIHTKAAIVGHSIEMTHYLLGNETQSLIDSRRKTKPKPEMINAVVTRSQSRLTDKDVLKNAERKEKNQTNSDSISETGSGETDRSDELLESEIEISSGIEDIELPNSKLNLDNELIGIQAETFMMEQKSCPELASIWEKVAKNKTTEFKIENELLFRISKDHRGNERKQLLVPAKYTFKIMSLCHDGYGSHMGVTKTKDKILRYYFWPNCINAIVDFVKSCDYCQRVGKSGEQKKAPLKLVPIITEVFSKINIDTVGPLPESSKGNRYLLTAICLASKYPEAIPIQSVSSENVTDALLTIFSRIGFPKMVQCDNGSYFTSNLTTTFFEKTGIKVSHSSIYHPQTNPVERFHRTIKRLLKTLCVELGGEWERHLPSALLALRNVTHNSTGFSPSELVYGRSLRVPETLIYEKWCKIPEQENVVTEYVYDLMNRLKDCQQLAGELETDLKTKRKGYYDRGAVKREFKPGDQVLVISACQPNKLSVKWVGPGVVEKKLSETNYIVKMPGKIKEQVYHINLLKPYYQRVECINILTSEECIPENVDSDLEIIYPVADPNIFDFREIIKDSMLTELCTSEQIEELGKLLKSHSKLFSNDPGRTHLIEHDIELISDKPVRSKPYRTSPRQNEILKSEIKRMLDLKIIEIGESDYTSPMILVESAGREPRPCIDYRRLNSLIRLKYYPLPNMDERVEKVSASKYITVIDLTKGYWQIPLSPSAQRLAAFVTTFGTYRPLVLPFGLVNAPYCFSKFMAQLLNGYDEFSVPYLDDVAIFSNSWEDHIRHVDLVLKRIAAANLTIKPAKCKFAQNCVKYLGHMVGGGKRTPTEAKIQAVVDFPTPKNKTQIRQFLGMSGYYARYIRQYAITAEPLTRALKGKNKKENVEWTEECDTAFHELKRKLTEKPVLYAPDFSKEFIVQTDASEKGIGVVLAQKSKDNTDHPILYLSKKFTESEKKFGTTEKECAAIIYAIKKLRHYLDGQHFTIETDHNPLVFLKTNAGNNPRLMRWALALQPFNYTIIHRAGKEIGHADCLSRMLS
jgi:hypothetical protein